MSTSTTGAFRLGIEICVHCYARRMPFYAGLLDMQLQSIGENPPEVEVVVSVVCHKDDEHVAKVLKKHTERLWEDNRVDVRPIRLPDEKLFQRAIGRNIVAKSTMLHVVWFTDCDYLFGEGAIDAATKACFARVQKQAESAVSLPGPRNIVHPEIVLTSSTHEIGDAQAREFRERGVLPPLYGFKPRKMKRAIGGIQVVNASYCRRAGYLNGQVPDVDDVGKGFRQCRGDVPFRKQAGGSLAVDIPNVMRIRHSYCGRDGGTVNHGRK